MYSILLMIFKMIISSNQMRRAVDGCCCDLSGEFSFDLKSMKHWNDFIRKIEIHILMWWDCQHQCSNFPRDGDHHKWNGGVIEVSGQFPFLCDFISFDLVVWIELFIYWCLWEIENELPSSKINIDHLLFSLLFLSFILHHQL